MTIGGKGQDECKMIEDCEKGEGGREGYCDISQGAGSLRNSTSCVALFFCRKGFAFDLGRGKRKALAGLGGECQRSKKKKAVGGN